jgi:hypothetical protein
MVDIKMKTNCLVRIRLVTVLPCVWSGIQRRRTFWDKAEKETEEK